MSFRRLAARVLTPPAVCLLAVTTAGVTGSPAAGYAATSGDAAGPESTLPAEARKVDGVAVPELAWNDCTPPELADKVQLSCSSLNVPLNYDNPDDGTLALSIIRRRPAGAAEGRPTLFVNPGGPGDSAAVVALRAEGIVSEKILDHFDIIGVDPRGVTGAPRVSCFDDRETSNEVLGNLLTPPKTPEDREFYQQQAKKWAEACARPENQLAGHINSTNVARDMDVVRRALGEDKLNYFGVSYGSILGQHYANLFPDRFRTIAIDGVMDAADWAGASNNSSENIKHRVGSAAASERALAEVLRRCNEVGKKRCSLAASSERGDSEDAFEMVQDSLAKKPLEFDIDKLYADSPGERPPWFDSYPRGLQLDDTVMAGFASAALRQAAMTPEDLMVLTDAMSTVLVARDGQSLTPDELLKRVPEELKTVVRTTAPLLTLNYSSGTFSMETQHMVLCADGAYPGLQQGIDQAVDTTEYPNFGPQWGMLGVSCAPDNWQITEHGKYSGPFYRHTHAAPLIIGNTWDPVTNHDQAAQLADRSPNANFLTSDSWGHGAMWSSDCATTAIEQYLITGESARQISCTGDYQPFEKDQQPHNKQTVDALAWPPILGLPPVAK